MRSWIVIVITAVMGVAIGFALRPHGARPVQIIQRPFAPAKGSEPVVQPLTFKFPDLPKPPIEAPTAVPDLPTQPSAFGTIPHLPSAGPGSMEMLSGDAGSIGPISPSIPSKLPVADLNADEALARRTILGNGGEIVSSDDAKDSSGKIGRSVVAETEATGRDGLRKALRKALGDRIVMSDAGTVPASTPELKKAEDDLAVARKKRDQARIDFLPEAPALRQIEEDYLALEKSVSDRRRQSARVRLNILIRPTL